MTPTNLAPLLSAELPTYKRLPIHAVRGEGPYLYAEDGTQYTDLYGGHCVTILGHCHPAVVQAIQQQAAQLMFYSNVVGSPLRAAVARQLAHVLPLGMGHVFFCNSGAEANENALKLAWQQTGRPHVVAFEGGFHGRTLGALAVSASASLRRPFRQQLATAHFLPWADEAALEAYCQRLGEQTAAIILEPIQSMAGMREAPQPFFQKLRSLCDAHGIYLVLDEVQTGVGRTGTFSYSEQLGIRPDLITMAKSLANGLPIGLVAAEAEVASQVQPGDMGSTFGGGMLAMAACQAVLHELVQGQWMSHARALHATLEQKMAGTLVQVRGAGALIGLVLPFPAAPIRQQLLQVGWLVGGAEDPNVIRLMPPINLPLSLLEAFADRLLALLPTHAPTTQDS